MQRGVPMIQSTIGKPRWKDLPLHLKLLVISAVTMVVVLLALFFVTGMMILFWGEPV
jgi:hypothetical protein